MRITVLVCTSMVVSVICCYPAGPEFPSDLNGPLAIPSSPNVLGTRPECHVCFIFLDEGDQRLEPLDLRLESSQINKYTIARINEKPTG